MRARQASIITSIIAATWALAGSIEAQGIAAVRDYQPGIDAQHYAFTVVLPDSGRRIEVSAAAHIRRTHDVDTVRFDLESAMRVARVTLGGREVAFSRDAHTVGVPLPRRDASCAGAAPRASDAPDRCVDLVSIEAAGEPVDGLIITRDSAGHWLYFTDHWPNRARNWLPTIDHPSDKATVEWRVNAPSTLMVVANGRLLARSPLPNSRGRSITVWRTDRPLPSYLMAIAAAPMARVNIGATACGFAERGGCVEQDVYESPDLAPRTPPGFAAAAGIVTWLSRWVAPFPYEKLSHLQSSTRFGGMENASAIFYADAEFRTLTLGERLVAHETAHQWFGDAVTPARWADVWLSEGFATYFAALWARQPAPSHADPQRAFRSALATIKQKVLVAEEVRTRPVVDSTQTDLMELLDANSYQKGGFVLHMLRQQLGDSAWIRGIRSYYARYLHGNATTDDLRAAMETQSKSSLKWFFDQWLTRPGFAELEATWTWDDARLAVHVRQTGRFGAFRLRLPVEVETADHGVERVVIDVPAAAESRIAVPIRGRSRPTRVTYDPDGDVLAVITVP